MSRVRTQQLSAQQSDGAGTTTVGVLDRYGRSAPRIDGYYSKDLVRSLSSRMIDKLELQETDALVDLGCGTGRYAREIIEQVTLRRPVLAVDPVRQMLERVPKTPRIATVLEDALTFSQSSNAYSKVLIKDVLYHVQRGTTLLANLHRNLPVGGILLLVHSSPVRESPLFPEARSRWSTWHPEASELMNLLAHVGFTVDREEVDFEREVPRERYLGMIRDRYFPILSTFDDTEIEEGIKGLSYAAVMKDRLQLTEHFDFVTAKKM